MTKQDVSTYRTLIGSDSVGKTYAASLLNISAMSYGSLSRNAILALNKGAKEGGFYQDTARVVSALITLKMAAISCVKLVQAILAQGRQAVIFRRIFLLRLLLKLQLK